MAIGFIPPPDLEYDIYHYALIMALSLVGCISPALILFRSRYVD